MKRALTALALSQALMLSAMIAPAPASADIYAPCSSANQSGPEALRMLLSGEGLCEDFPDRLSCRLAWLTNSVAEMSRECVTYE
jgi:hypothetical protein